MDWNDPHCEDPQNARHAVNNYACAYKMSPTYQKVLTNFLKTGTCTGRNKCYTKPPAKCLPECWGQCHWEMPMEGFFQCAVDVDPTKAGLLFLFCTNWSIFPLIHIIWHWNNESGEFDLKPNRFLTCDSGFSRSAWPHFNYFCYSLLWLPPSLPLTIIESAWMTENHGWIFHLSRMKLSATWVTWGTF